jgi:hypothetical protein
MKAAVTAVLKRPDRMDGSPLAAICLPARKALSANAYGRHAFDPEQS